MPVVQIRAYPFALQSVFFLCEKSNKTLAAILLDPPTTVNILIQNQTGPNHNIPSSTFLGGEVPALAQLQHPNKSSSLLKTKGLKKSVCCICLPSTQRRGSAALAILNSFIQKLLSQTDVTPAEVVQTFGQASLLPYQMEFCCRGLPMYIKKLSCGQNQEATFP